MENNLLKSILDNEFLETLAKSADLYKIGSNSVLDPEEIRIGLKVVPRAVMSMLISELSPMEINSHKDIKLPFGKDAYISANKNSADNYTGSVYSGNKLVYDFKNRSIPGLGIILLSTFELYDMEELDKPSKESVDMESKIQKLIDQRMELHSLVSRVVEDKMSQREALHKLMMAKLSEVIKKGDEQFPKIEPAVMSPPGPQMHAAPIEVKSADIVKKELAKAVTRDKYGPAASTGHEKGVHVGTEFRDVEKPFAGQSDAGYLLSGGDKGSAIKEHKRVLGELKTMPKPNLPKSEEASAKKELPLKKFLDRKKNKSKEYSVKIEKSETVNCPDCMQPIFGSSGLSACICYGEDQNRKIWLKKSDDGISLRFSKSWSPENIEMLLETLRGRNGKN